MQCAVKKGNVMTTNKLQPQSSPTLITIPEAANQLRISKWMIYQLIRSNELKTMTIGRRRFTTTDDLNDFINERKEVEP